MSSISIVILFLLLPVATSSSSEVATTTTPPPAIPTAIHVPTATITTASPPPVPLSSFRRWIHPIATVVSSVRTFFRLPRSEPLVNSTSSAAVLGASNKNLHDSGEIHINLRCSPNRQVATPATHPVSRAPTSKRRRESNSRAADLGSSSKNIYDSGASHDIRPLHRQVDPPATHPVSRAPTSSWRREGNSRAAADLEAPNTNPNLPATNHHPSPSTCAYNIRPCREVPPQPAVVSQAPTSRYNLRPRDNSRAAAVDLLGFHIPRRPRSPRGVVQATSGAQPNLVEFLDTIPRAPRTPRVPVV